MRFTRDERAETLRACIAEAFKYFDGVPQHVLLDNASTIVIERDAYGPGEHRWHALMLAAADEFGFTPRLCRPYRARTKGKVERFNGYLKRSFCVPLATTLKQAGLRFDADVANAHVGRWLADVANCRIHGTTLERPDRRMVAERAALLPLPHSMTEVALPLTTTTRPIPVESIQHPLSVYNELLEMRE